MTSPEDKHYLAAAHAAIKSIPVIQYTTAGVIDTAVEAGVLADRKRMAETLRTRVLYGRSDAPDEIAMKFDEVIFHLADQVERGMPFRPTSITDIHPTQIKDED